MRTLWNWIRRLWRRFLFLFGGTMSEEEEFWNRVLDTLAVVPGCVQRVIASGVMPSSKAAAEKESLVGDAQRQKFLDQLPPRAFTNILVIGEGVEGVTRLLRMPPIEVMPAPVGRAGLISSGLVLWLTDPTIQPQNRVGRIIRVLADDLKNARKVANKGKSIARGDQATAVEEAVKNIDELEAKLDKDSTGLARPNLPNDEALAALTESGYEYEIYTHISHGNPAVINEMRAMYRGDEGAAASALTNVILAALHAYGLAAWALGSYILEGRRLEELRTLVIQMYQAIGAASDFYGYPDTGDAT